MSELEEKMFFKESHPVNIYDIKPLYSWIICLKDVEPAQNLSLQQRINVLMERDNIFNSNKKFLTEKYGQQDFSIEYLTHERLDCWKFVLNNLGYFWIETSYQNGTSIEVKMLENVNEGEFCQAFKNKIRDIFNIHLF